MVDIIFNAGGLKMRNIRRLKREENAVSPVIATILLVAITVVLSASLWMMVDADDEISRDLYGTTRVGDRSRNEGWVRMDIGSMSPSSIDLEDVTVRLFNSDDTRVCSLEGEMENSEGPYTLRWVRTDDRVKTTSRLRVEYEEGYDFSGYEVLITAEGFSGSLKQRL